jgi:hypothetical protein
MPTTGLSPTAVIGVLLCVSSGSPRVVRAVDSPPTPRSPLPPRATTRTAEARPDGTGRRNTSLHRTDATRADCIPCHSRVRFDRCRQSDSGVWCRPMAGSTGGGRKRDRWSLLPIVGWIRTYDRKWLRGDLIAGVAVAALIVPKNLGYAGIAGIPLQNGLYAAAAGAILYAVFGTSRQISTGPSSGLAAVAASAVLAASITGPDVASFVATITLASGALFLLLAAFKIPLRCGHRHGHRRASQAHRHTCLWFQSDPKAVLVDRIPRRDQCAHCGRRTSRTALMWHVICWGRP